MEEEGGIREGKGYRGIIRVYREREHERRMKVEEKRREREINQGNRRRWRGMR